MRSSPRGHGPASSEPQTDARTRVALVTVDMVGPIRNGGVGTAFLAAAENLRDDGYDVTIVYPTTYFETLPLTYWVEDYARRGLKFVPLFIEGSSKEVSYLTYQWLKKQPFDVVHFHDMQGVGYWSCVAKRQGLAFENTQIVVQVHGQTYWAKVYGGEFIDDLSDLERDFLEQRSVELADAIFSPSQYMVDYMVERGWKMPASVFVQPNLLPDRILKAMDPEAPRPERTVDEVVFYGRIETRKGLEIFLSALARVKASGQAFSKVTFLGKIGRAGTDPAGLMIADAMAKIGWSWQILNDRDVFQALDYLKGEGRVAVIASSIENSPYTVLECLAMGVPFISADVGGVRELIHQEDQARTLFPRTDRALARTLLRLKEEGVSAARPHISVDEARVRWLDWHRGLTPKDAELAAGEAGRARPAPLVSVCMSTFNRPALLDQALESVKAQTYPNIEMVLIDDASPGAEQKAYVERIAPEFEQRGWKLIVNPEEVWTSRARNQAVAAASGEYVLLMDDDNIAKPHEVETFVQAALSSGADVLSCQQQGFEGMGAPPVEDPRSESWMPIGQAMSLALYENCLGDLNMFVRRDVYLETGGFSEDIGAGCEDYEFLAKLVFMGKKLEVVPEALFYYRSSNLNLGKRYDEFALYNSFFRVLRQFTGVVQPEMRMALTYANQRHLSAIKSARGAYWNKPGPKPGTLKADYVHADLNGAASMMSLARIAWESRQSHAAASLAEQAMRLGASPADCLRIIGEASLKVGDLDILRQAGARAAPVAGEAQVSQSLRLFEGRELLDQGRPEEALSKFREAEAQGGGAETQFWLGQALARTGERGAAMDLIRTALLDPQLVERIHLH